MAHLQICLGIHAVDALVIGYNSVPAQKYVESPMSKASAFSGELLKSLQ